MSADTVGIVAATACAVHCVALPLLVASTPLLFLDGLLAPWIEWAFVGVSLLVGLVSFRDTLHPGRARTPLWRFVAGLGVLLVVRTFVRESAWLERGGLVLAASLIISAHVRHAREVRACARTATAGGIVD